MKINVLRSLTCVLLILSAAASLLRADHDADLRNEIIPSGHKMHAPHRMNKPLDASGPAGNGYTPQQMRHAYGFDQLGATGAGQVIAIVDAYGDPTIQTDVDTFCAALNIPSTGVLVFYPQGTPVEVDNWAIETALDVEWAHAIAPDATIVLVAAQSDSNADLFAAVDYAVSLGATQVSMSWGGAEYSSEGTSDFHFNVPGVTFFASSGDSGAGASYPACSPYVVGVGGTTLNLDSSGNIISETGWPDSGGGPSVYETEPSYQSGWWSGPGRATPDVAYDADPNTGVPVFQSYFQWFSVGGTSAGAPQWAAFCALANSLSPQSLSSAPGAFYSLATANYAGYYHDIISGSNGAYSAGPGYDLVTGLGSPVANQLVIALAGGFSSQTAAPAFSPDAGAYPSGSPQSVTILSATPGASIRYTTDGSTPSETAGTLYSNPVSISAATTLKAIAYKSGLTDSLVTSGSYTFLAQAAEPTFSPVAGSYSFAHAVMISTTTSGSTIRYTTDGSTPTETYGTIYTGPVGIKSSSTLQAIAYKSGLLESPVASGDYTINSLVLLASLPSGGPLDAALVQGTDGNFYGNANDGTIFKVTPAGVITILATLSGANGTNPFRGMIQGTDGNFYGEAYSGGANNDGTVFKMTPAGVITALASFNGANGASPMSVLVQGTDGNFYGTTYQGGSANDGTVFKLTPAGVLTTLVSFNGANGNDVESGLVQGTDGNFYGTTAGGGSYGDGTIFKITPSGVLTTLVNFYGPNGRQPYAALTLANDGNFYGVTDSGGSLYVSNDNPGYGIAFKMTPTGVLTVLVSFDGNSVANQDAKLTQGRDGNFYSANYYGGISEGYGNVFEMTPEGVVTVMGWFNIVDGMLPFASLIQGTDGNFYGTAESGGSTGSGTIYELILPPQAAAPTFSPAAGLYTSAQTVTISTTTSGAMIRYTTDGSIPTEATGTLYSGPVVLGTNATTLKAIAYAVGSSDSSVTSGTYAIGLTLSSSNGFYNIPMPSAQSGIFTASFDASPSLSPSNTVIGLSQGAQTAYTGISCIARFNTSGDIDAYNGSSGYQAATTIPYSKGLTYHFRMVVNVPANTYSVYVTPPGKGETLVGSNYGFRKAATSLNTWTIDVNSSPGGTATVSNLSVVGIQQVGAPVFSPPAGTYSSAQAVMINTVTGGASIRYTTDGSTPSETAGTLYSGPVSLSSTVTLKAIAYESGMTDSPVTSGLYTINLQVAAPTFSPPATVAYNSVISVAISTTTSGASIRYTTDGSTPSETAGTLYSSPVPINTNGITLNAIAYKSGLVDSAVTSALYTLQCAQPGFSPTAGVYSSAQTVTITSDTTGVTTTIRYTTDGSTPTETNGTLYSGPVLISTTTELKAVAYAPGFLDSPWTGGLYTINTSSQVAAPSFSPVAGTYTAAQTVTITTTTSGASIRYTTDGSTPSETAGTLYSSPVSISATATLKAIAYESGYTDSTVTSGLYTINLPQVVAPSFSPVAGTYTAAQTVAITTTTSGASIRYTTDGSTPSETAGTLYSSPVSISATATLKAIAYKTGMTDSTVTTGQYTISPPQVAAPTFNPGAGTYTSPQTVAITTTTSGASIRYTTDGSTPSETAGTLYSSPVSISTTATLKAIAYKSGMTDSTVTTGQYTINSTTRSLTGSSGNGFHALALTASQTGTFTATFDATPTVSPENAVVGLSKGAATAYGNLSCIARFNPSGDIDAYSGTGYITSTIPYSANLTYHFSMVVNVSTHTYSVYVTPAGGSQLTVGTNLAFRSTANTVTSLDTWNLDVDATPANCSLTANNLNP